MRNASLIGIPVLLAFGFFVAKWALAGTVNAERLVALGGMYHWSAQTAIVLIWSIRMVRTRETSGSFWGDFKTTFKPLVFYAALAAGTVWGWNHVIAADATALRKSLRLAQIEEVTSSDEAYESFLESQGNASASAIPDRLTYREQAEAQVEWMLSGGVTLVLSMLIYLFAALILALTSTFLLHHIWGISSLS